MSNTLQDALKNRRSCRELTADCPLTPAQVEALCGFALNNVPSSFNSQSTRLVLLTGTANRTFWNIVLETLRPLVPAEKFGGTETKITLFAAGTGTILFFEDRAAIEKLQAEFPSYRDRFPAWSEHTSAMHQLALWLLLEDAGCGASLQHYNPIIDQAVAQTWNLDPTWKLIAQMPYGGIRSKPAAPEKQPLSTRLNMFSE